MKTFYRYSNFFVSKIPNPLSFGIINNKSLNKITNLCNQIYQENRSKNKNIQCNDNPLTIVYKTVNEYFIYIDDIQDEDTFMVSTLKSIRDYSKLINMGIYLDTAPFRHSDRKYIYFQDLFKYYYGVRSLPGPGRISKIESSLLYSNWRASGLADFDFNTRQNLIRNMAIFFDGAFNTNDMRNIMEGVKNTKPDPDILEYILDMNELGITLLFPVIVKLKRMGNHNKNNTGNYKDNINVEDLTKFIQKLSIFMLKGYMSNYDYDPNSDIYAKIVNKLLFNSNINSEVMSKQFLFWYFPENYLEYVNIPSEYDNDSRTCSKQPRLPSDILSNPNDRFCISKELTDTIGKGKFVFDPEKGFLDCPGSEYTSECELSFGPFNSTLFITEFVKYSMLLTYVVAYYGSRFTPEQILSIIS